jgi:hypothetical protein
MARDLVAAGVEVHPARLGELMPVAARTRGWRFVMRSDEMLSVTTPSGITRTTRPPGLDPPGPAPDDDPPPF